MRGQGSKSRNSKSWSHSLTKGAKAVCIRKPACREESRQGPMEDFLDIMNIQLVNMNIQLGGDSQIALERAGADKRV